MALITLDQAKTQCKIPLESVEYDDDLTLKIEHATALVVDFMNRSEDDWVAGSPQASPADQEFPLIQAAILAVLLRMWRRVEETDTQYGPMTPAIERMLRGLRIPAIG